MTINIIKGAKGGGKGGSSQSTHIPYEAPNTLRAKQYARVIDLVSEGEVEALLVNGAKSIYLDETPVQNADGSYNFQGLTIETRSGTPSQTYMPGFPSAETEIAVSVEVTYSTSVTRTISNANVNRVRVTVSVPSLYYQDPNNSDLTGNSVQLRIDVQANGGGYVTKVTDTISGKTMSKYPRAYEIPLTGSAPWDVRVVRVSTDATQSYDQRDTWFDSYTEIIDNKFSYPHSALIGMQCDAAQFRAIPRRAYHVKGIKLTIPSNYNPTNRTYSGTWDGTFQVAYSNNPVWAFYTLATNVRFGLGEFINPLLLDKWTLYTISQYCDEFVPDGLGGYEPRFTCNAYFQSAQEGLTLLRNLAAVFRGMIIESGGLLSAICDMPDTAVAIYTNANVINGEFTYTGTSRSARHTVALVSWNDMSDFCRQKIESYEDPDGIARYGVRPLQLNPIGVTSRGMAKRTGKWAILSEITQDQLVQFRAGADVMLAPVGRVIKIADKYKTGERIAGRVVSATTTAITVDQAPTYVAGMSALLITPSGNVEERGVSSIVGSTINLSSALSVAPQVNSVWCVTKPTVQASEWRLLAVNEIEDNLYECTAVFHNPSKYDAVEQGIVLQTNPFIQQGTSLNPPINITHTENLYENLGVVRSRVTFSWESPTGVVPARYEVVWKVGDGNYTPAQTVSALTYDIFDAKPGTYAVQVSSISSTGRKSLPASYFTTIYGKAAPPADVQNLRAASVGGNCQLTWSLHTDLDVRIGGNIVIRYSPKTSGAAWSDGAFVKEVPGSATDAICPMLDGTYLVRARDSSDNYSINPVLVIITNASLIELNVVNTQTESPTFPGSKTNMTVVGSALRLSSGQVDGTYSFQNTVDLTDPQNVRVWAEIDSHSYLITDLIDSRSDPIDSWATIDNEEPEGVEVWLEVRTTLDNPGGSPTWSAWQKVFSSEFYARGFQFRLRMTVPSTAYNDDVLTLKANVDVPDRVESARNVTSSAGGTAVTFSRPFYGTPAIAITGNNLATGDYWAVTSQTKSGFTIQFFNSGGTGIARNFDWLAKGY